MITFGYRSRFSGPLRALTAIAIGLVMVISRTDALELVVRIIAAFLVASGVVSLIVGYKNRTEDTFKLMGFNGIFDILIGLLLLIFTKSVAGLLVYFIAFCLIGLGLFQLVILISARKDLGLNVWSYILPSLVLAAGIFLMFNPPFVGEAIGVVAGASIIVYGVSELLSSWRMKKVVKYYEIENVDEQ